MWPKETIPNHGRMAKWLPVAVFLSWSGVIAFGVFLWRERSRHGSLVRSETVDIVRNVPGTPTAHGFDSTGGSDALATQFKSPWPRARREGWVVIPAVLIEHSLGDWSLNSQPKWDPDVLKALGLQEEDIESLNGVVARQYRTFMERMAARAKVLTTSEASVVMELPPVSGEAGAFFAAVAADTATLLEPEKAAGIQEMLKLAQSMVRDGGEQRLTLTSDGATVTITREQLTPIDPEDPAGCQWRLMDQRGYQADASGELADWLKSYRPVIDSFAGLKPSFLKYEP